jgi:hypothetical protein
VGTHMWQCWLVRGYGACVIDAVSPWDTGSVNGSYWCISVPDMLFVNSPTIFYGLIDVKASTYIFVTFCAFGCSVYKDVMLPELRNGDWLMFPNAGGCSLWNHDCKCMSPFIASVLSIQLILESVHRRIHRGWSMWF